MQTFFSSNMFINRPGAAFLMVYQIDFFSSHKSLKRSYFDQIVCAEGEILPKQAKNLVHFGAEAAFRKILGSASQKSRSQKSTKGDPLGRQGVESLKWWCSPLPNPLVKKTLRNSSPYLNSISCYC